MVTNFTRYISRIHSEEIYVSQVLVKPKGSKERKVMFEILRYKGNFFDSKHSLSDNCGSLIVGQRPGNGTNAHTTDYLPCKNCLGFFPVLDCTSQQFKIIYIGLAE